MLDKEVWEELERLNEFAIFPQDKLPGHLKHLRDYNLESVEEYQEFTDLLTKYPAIPIGRGTIIYNTRLHKYKIYSNESR